eukprot:11175903-Lingulodinium_polyedra.AAC.1
MAYPQHKLFNDLEYHPWGLATCDVENQPGAPGNLPNGPSEPRDAKLRQLYVAGYNKERLAATNS